MAEETIVDSPSGLEEVLEGAPQEIKKQVNEALLNYAAPSKGAQEEIMKATKLRGAFTVVQNWLLAQMLPDLNDDQWLFLSTGLLGTDVTLTDKAGKPVEIELVPKTIYEKLREARGAKGSRPPWTAPILDFEDRIQAIAKGELVGLDSSQSRRRKPTKPIGSEHYKEKVKGRLEGIVASLKEALSGVDSQVAAFAPLREEKLSQTLRLNLEALKKFIALAAKNGPRSEQENRLISSVRDKTGAVTRSLGDLGSQMERIGHELASRSDALDVKFAELKSCLSDIQKLESGEVTNSAAFDPETIGSIRKDEDTLTQFVVKGAENSENKVTFSGARVLVKEQWRTEDLPEAVLATVPGVIAAIEKIAKIHINVFPRDTDGQFLLPPIIIEPIRNYVEYFDDRLVISMVAGDPPKKGPKISLSPLEMQVLRACGNFLCKDPLYDYHGDLNIGTFIGDYSGRVEKKTQVKWVGDDKKFSMASTSQVVDAASRSEAVNDYVECIFAFSNGLNPPQKLSRRKVGVILRYCVIESIEKTVAHTLMHVAQSETNEAKETILKHGKTEEKARELVKKAFDDPQVAKVCGDRDYFVTKLFGRQT